eukprot:scaffold79482_cov69-Phaeocystis_antarctica.AAC.4
MHQCANAPMHQCTNAPRASMHQCTNAPMHPRLGPTAAPRASGGRRALRAGERVVRLRHAQVRLAAQARGVDRRPRAMLDPQRALQHGVGQQHRRRPAAAEGALAREERVDVRRAEEGAQQVEAVTQQQQCVAPAIASRGQSGHRARPPGCSPICHWLQPRLPGGFDPNPTQQRVALVSGDRERQYVLEAHLGPQPCLARLVQRVARLPQPARGRKHAQQRAPVGQRLEQLLPLRRVAERQPLECRAHRLERHALVEQCELHRALAGQVAQRLERHKEPPRRTHVQLARGQLHILLCRRLWRRGVHQYELHIVFDAIYRERHGRGAVQ